MKKIISLSLAALMLLPILFGCTESGNDPTATDSTEVTSKETTGEAVTSGFPLFKSGEVPVIRFSVMASGTEFDTVKMASASLAAKFKVDVRKEDDFTIDGSATEILIGDTGYPETAEAKRHLSFNEGIITVIGKKLVFAASEPDALADALSAFLEDLSAFKQPNGDYIIPEDYTLVNNENATLKGVPMIEGKKPELYDSGDNCYQFLYAKSKESDYTGYVNTLKAENYRLTAQNALDGNLFSTLTNGEKIINVIWTPNTEDLRVFIDPTSYSALPNSAEENVYDKTLSVTPTVTQIGLFAGETVKGSGSDAGVSCSDRYYASGDIAGMAYVIRLSDGSFIVIDGGYATDLCKTNLYNVLKKQAPDPDHIVIAAWIFSHGHGDHVGVVPSFLSTYAKNITVEKFIFNFPASQYDIGEVVNVRGALKNVAYKNAKIIKAHPGQVDYVRNAKINILFTMEMMEPWDFNYYNDCSVVFSIEIGGQTLLFMADTPDTSAHEGAFVLKMYGNALKADILQVAHHGINDNGENVMYAKHVKPTWAFLPAAGWQVAVPQSGGKIVYCNDFERKYNAPIAQMPADHVFVAGSGLQMLTINNQTVTAKTWESVADYLK